jgi:hypothetical protein
MEVGTREREIRSVVACLARDGFDFGNRERAVLGQPHFLIVCSSGISPSPRAVCIACLTDRMHVVEIGSGITAFLGEAGLLRRQ